MRPASERRPLASWRSAQPAEPLAAAQAWVAAEAAQLGLAAERRDHLLAALTDLLGTRPAQDLTAVPVTIQVTLADAASFAETAAASPAQSKAAWGFFVIDRLVGGEHLIEVVLYREGDAPAARDGPDMQGSP
jgi:hypothetical protein